MLQVGTQRATPPDGEAAERAAAALWADGGVGAAGEASGERGAAGAAAPAGAGDPTGGVGPSAEVARDPERGLDPEARAMLRTQRQYYDSVHVVKEQVLFGTLASWEPVEWPDMR